MPSPEASRLTARLRRARPEDAASVAALHADSWRRTYRGILRDEFLDGEVERERTLAWTAHVAALGQDDLLMVAEAEGVLVGFVCARGRADDRWGTLVDNLHVAMASQGTGLGSTLLGEVARWSMARYPGAAVHLRVARDNRHAREFYERRGARAEQSLVLPNPGGGSATYLLYVWSTAEALLESLRIHG